MQWQNELTSILGVKYPVILAPMLGVTTPKMVAIISEAGGLGSLAVGGLSPEKASSLIQQTKALTSKPFAVNFFAHDIPQIDLAKAETMQDLLEKLCSTHEIPFERQAVESLHFYSYKDQIEVLLDKDIAAVSFTFGVPDTDILAAFRAKGIPLIGTATSLKEATLLDLKDIDIICSQGIEAGGHRGSFIDSEPLPEVGVMPLVSGAIQNTRRPVIAAGGINDGRTTKAAFTLGAKGVQIGTAFLASDESGAIASYKACLANALETDVVLTRAFSGRWARGIRNTMMNEVEKSGLDIPPYPIQNSLTTLLRATAQKMNNKEFTNLWAGQSASRAEAKPMLEIWHRIIRETEELQ